MTHAVIYMNFPNIVVSTLAGSSESGTPGNANATFSLLLPGKVLYFNALRSSGTEGTKMEQSKHGSACWAWIVHYKESCKRMCTSKITVFI